MSGVSGQDIWQHLQEHGEAVRKTLSFTILGVTISWLYALIDPLTHYIASFSNTICQNVPPGIRVSEASW